MSSDRSVSALFFVVGFLATAPADLAAKHAELAQPQRYINDVKYLAAPERQGRGAGTAGLEQASRYIASEFQRLGLQPAGENASWWQSFRVTASAHPGTQNQLTVAGRPALTLNSDFLPLSFSSTGKFEGDVVFAGYGITAPEFRYDDYAGIDVRDKIVLLLRYEPPQFHANRPGPADRAYTHHAHLVNKAINARNHGAKAVILANGSLTKEDKLIAFGTVAGPENAGLLIVQVRNTVADDLLRASNVSLAELQNRINSKQHPASIATAGHAAIRVDIQREQAEVKNVLGFLPGTTNEYIIVGAHYDHLGLGGEGSLAPSKTGQVHPGADDNASGTAGVIEVARILSGQKRQMRRGVLFMTFAGEEIGLLGSAYWVNHPTMPLQDAVAMLNLDMIGRVNGAKLYLGGSGTGSTFDPMLKRILPEYDFKVDYSEDGFSASDHTSFASKSIPVLFFFSGLHGDYHKPTDTWEKISTKGATEVVDLVAEITKELAQAETRPQYIKVEPKSHARSGGDGGGSGYGPYFGSIPDFAPVEKGVKFSDVRAGSPAAKAGLKAGDILIAFGDKPINNLYDFTFALRESKVGDVVKVTVVRDGKQLTADVKLETRR